MQVERLQCCSPTHFSFGCKYNEIVGHKTGEERSHSTRTDAVNGMQYVENILKKEIRIKWQV